MACRAVASVIGKLALLTYACYNVISYRVKPESYGHVSPALVPQ
jgi:hypothetical protein